MERAYSTLEIKAIGEDSGKRIFTGIASTITPDRMGDIVEPKGAVFKLPIPLLFQHDHGQPIGWVTDAKVGTENIQIIGEVAVAQEDGALKQRLDEAWQSMKLKLVRALSIGFRPIESSDIEGDRWARRFIKWEWLEQSVVTIPANSQATILSIKSFDIATRAALGLTRSGPVRLVPRPGASGVTAASRGFVQLIPKVKP